MTATRPSKPTPKVKQNIKIGALHIAIKKELLKSIPLQCTKCGSTEKIELANMKDHIYTDNPNDYTFLCVKCHKAHDWNPDNHRTSQSGNYEQGGCPHPAVTPAAIAIAKKYGKSVSKGIVEMETEICVLQYAVKVGKQEIARMRKTFDKYQLV